MGLPPLLEGSAGWALGATLAFLVVLVAILNSEVLNYSSLAREGGLILHTTVGIGYDTPWRQVEAMLLEAAARSPDRTGSWRLPDRPCRSPDPDGTRLEATLEPDSRLVAQALGPHG